MSAPARNRVRLGSTRATVVDGLEHALASAGCAGRLRGVVAFLSGHLEHSEPEIAALLERALDLDELSKGTAP